MVADAFIKKSNHSLTSLIVSEDLSKEFNRMNVEIIQEGELESSLSALLIQPIFFEEIMTKFVRLRE